MSSGKDVTGDRLRKPKDPSRSCNLQPGGKVTSRGRIALMLMTAWISLYSAVPVPPGHSSGKLSLRFSREPLRAVLKTISDCSGVGFVFQDDLVEGRTVTCSLEGLSLDQALERILSPLSISFKRVPSGPVVLYDAKTAERLIRGWVVDASSGNGLPFANIRQDGTSNGTTSDHDGRFTLRGSGQDSCVIRVSYIGYAPEQIRLTEAVKPDTIRIGLREHPIETASVEVESDRIPMLDIASEPGQIVFSPAKLDIVPNVEKGSFGRTLQMLPGLDAALDQSAILGFHGGMENENLFLLDGIPLRKPATFYRLLAPLHPGLFEKVIVWKGAYPAKYGDQTGGIVELTGNTVPERRFNAGIGADLFSSNAFIAYPFGGNWSLFLAGRRSHDRILDGRYYGPIGDFLLVRDPLFPDGVWFSNDVVIDSTGHDGSTDLYVNPSRSYSFADAAGKIAYSGTGGNRFGSTFFYKIEKDRYTAAAEIGTVDHFRSEYQRNENYGVSVTWGHDWNGSRSLGLTAAYGACLPRYGGTTRYVENGEIIHLGRDRYDDSGLEDYIFRCDNRLNSGRHALEYGIEFARSDIQTRWNRYYQEQYEHRTYSNEENGESLEGIVNKIAYVQDMWSPVPAVRLSCGLRLIFTEFRSRFGPVLDEGYAASYQAARGESRRHAFVDPRISAEFRPFDRFKAVFGFGRHRQFILNRKLSLSYLNPSIVTDSEWEKARSRAPFPDVLHLVLDLQYETERWFLGMEGYDRKYPDLWPYDPAYATGGSGSSRGMEWILRKKSGFLTGWLSYRLNRSEYRVTGSSDSSYHYNPVTPADLDRTHEFKAVAAFELASIRFSVAGCLASGKPYTVQKGFQHLENGWRADREPENSSRLPSYQRVDVQAARRFDRVLGLSWDVSLSLLNVLDRENVLFRLPRYSGGIHIGEWERTTAYDLPMLGFTPMASVGVSLH